MVRMNEWMNEWIYSGELLTSAQLKRAVFRWAKKESEWTLGNKRNADGSPRCGNVTLRCGNVNLRHGNVYLKRENVNLRRESLIVLVDIFCSGWSVPVSKSGAVSSEWTGGVFRWSTGGLGSQQERLQTKSHAGMQETGQKSAAYIISSDVLLQRF